MYVLTLSSVLIFGITFHLQLSFHLCFNSLLTLFSVYLSFILFPCSHLPVGLNSFLLQYVIFLYYLSYNTSFYLLCSSYFIRLIFPTPLLAYLSLIPYFPLLIICYDSAFLSLSALFRLQHWSWFTGFCLFHSYYASHVLLYIFISFLYFPSFFPGTPHSLLKFILAFIILNFLVLFCCLFFSN